jgi:hypothetical protein
MSQSVPLHVDPSVRDSSRIAEKTVMNYSTRDCLLQPETEPRSGWTWTPATRTRRPACLYATRAAEPNGGFRWYCVSPAAFARCTSVWNLSVNATITLVHRTLYNSGGFEWLHFPVLFVLNTKAPSVRVLSDVPKQELLCGVTVWNRHCYTERRSYDTWQDRQLLPRPCKGHWRSQLWRERLQRQDVRTCYWLVVERRHMHPEKCHVWHCLPLMKEQPWPNWSGHSLFLKDPRVHHVAHEGRHCAQSRLRLIQSTISRPVSF